MIALLLLEAFAAPTSEVSMEVARLVEDRSTLDGLEEVEVKASLVGGLPWIEIRNSAATPLLIHWAESTISPPNSSAVSVLPLVRAEHDPILPIGPILVDTLAAGVSKRWAVFPKEWAEDRIDNAEQISTWSNTSFSGIELSLSRGELKGQYTALWRTEIDQEVLETLLSWRTPTPVNRVVPMPVQVVDLEARQRWDRGYRTYRKRAKSARTIWITAVVIGSAFAVQTAVSAGNVASAPTNSGRGEYTREDYRNAMWLYSGVAATSFGVAVPLFLAEQDATHKLRDLGPRP